MRKPEIEWEIDRDTGEIKMKVPLGVQVKLIGGEFYVIARGSDAAALSLLIEKLLRDIAPLKKYERPEPHRAARGSVYGYFTPQEYLELLKPAVKKFSALDVHSYIRILVRPSLLMACLMTHSSLYIAKPLRRTGCGAPNFCL